MSKSFDAQIELAFLAGWAAAQDAIEEGERRPTTASELKAQIVEFRRWRDSLAHPLNSEGSTDGN